MAEVWTRKTCVHVAVELLLRVVLMLVFLVIHTQAPFKRTIRPEDWDRISQRFNEDTVSEAAVGILDGGLIVVFILVPFIFGCISKSRHPEGHSRHLAQPNLMYIVTFLDACLGYSLSGCVTLLFTEVLKVMCGRPRPDYIERCFPELIGQPRSKVSDKIDELKELGPHVPNCTADNYTGNNVAVDQATLSKRMDNGRRSFPSGHAAMSFFALFFVAFFIWGQLNAFQQKTKGAWRFVAGFLFIIPAFVIAVSRTQDYRHHWEDIIVGGIIGTVFSYVSYRIYFPPLDSECSHLSYRGHGRTQLDDTASNTKIVTCQEVR